MPWSFGLCASAASADGLERVKLRMAETMAEVRFSRLYSAVGSDAGAWTVAWCCLILGRGSVPIRRVGVVPVPVPVVVLAVSDIDMDCMGVVRFGADGLLFSFTLLFVGVEEGNVVPVRAVHMALIGGSGSNQGVVKRGLSQRLLVLGSS